MSTLRSTRLRLALLAALTALALTVVDGSPAGAQRSDQTGQLTIVHGLRGQLVDIYVDGELLLPAFEPDRLTDPVPLPAGDYLVELRPAGSPSDSDPMFTGTVPVQAGDDIAVVAHYDDNGDWTATVYDNRLAPVPAGQSRLVFRNAARSPAVDVLVDDTVAVAALVAPAQDTIEVAPANVAVGARLADGTPAVTAQDVSAREGEATALYLVGDSDTGNLTWLMQSVAGLQTAPSGVPAGNSGLLGSDGSDGVSPLLIVVPTVFLGIGLVTWRARHRRAGREVVPCSAAY